MLVNAAQKMKFSIKDFFIKLSKFAVSFDLITFAEEILMENFTFMQCNFYHCPTIFIFNDIIVFFSTK